MGVGVKFKAKVNNHSFYVLCFVFYDEMKILISLFRRSRLCAVNRNGIYSLASTHTHTS